MKSKSSGRPRSQRVNWWTITPAAMLAQETGDRAVQPSRYASFAEERFVNQLNGSNASTEQSVALIFMPFLPSVLFANCEPHKR